MLFTHKGFSGPSVLDLSHFLIKSGLEKRQQQLELGQGNLARRRGVEPSALNESASSSGGGHQQPQESASLFVSWTGESAEVWEERLKV